MTLAIIYESLLCSRHCAKLFYVHDFIQSSQSPFMVDVILFYKWGISNNGLSSNDTEHPRNEISNSAPIQNSSNHYF